MNKSTALFLDSSAFSEGNAQFVEDLYETYLRDPSSVDPSWGEGVRQAWGQPARIGSLAACLGAPRTQCRRVGA